MSYRYFPQQQFTRMPWKNGGGTTFEIYREPQTGEDWHWRLSVAVIEQDGPFSAFPECERALILLTGEGMQLDFEEQQTPVLPPYGQVLFAGEKTPYCYLIEGPTQDFNAIWKRELMDLQVERRAMAGSLWCIAEAGVSWFVYFLSGTGRIKDDSNSPEIQAGDGIWLQPEKGQSRLVLEAHGEALWIKIQTR